MINSTTGIWLSQLLGVELHAPLSSNRFDHSNQLLPKALIFALFQNLDYEALIFHHDIHLLFVHFR